jgi:hypothetical protein
MKAINIIYYSETIDSWGRTESSMKGPIIYMVLMGVEDWNDDMVFEDDNGRKYNIDELKGQNVSLKDIGIFSVPNEE